MPNDDKVDLTNSKLTIELKDEKEIVKIEAQITGDINGGESDKNKRKRLYDKRRDFVAGRQEKYTNIVGLTQKSKQGHADQVVIMLADLLLKFTTRLLIILQTLKLCL